MIGLYAVLLSVSVLLFYLTKGFIKNAIIRFSIAAAFFVMLSILITIILIKGHEAPAGSKTVDMEEMERIHRELKKGNS